MMIWLNRTGWVQPIGKHYYDVIIAGTRWQLWYGKTDLPVISYVRTAPTTNVTNLRHNIPSINISAVSVSTTIRTLTWGLLDHRGSNLKHPLHLLRSELSPLILLVDEKKWLISQRWKKTVNMEVIMNVPVVHQV